MEDAIMVSNGDEMELHDDEVSDLDIDTNESWMYDLQDQSGAQGQQGRCPYMEAHASLDNTNVFNQNYRSLWLHFSTRAKMMLEKTNVKAVYCIFQCQFEKAIKELTTPIGRFFQHRNIKEKVHPPLLIREAVKGGN